jgi:hypothetical protein
MSRFLLRYFWRRIPRLEKFWSVNSLGFVLQKLITLTKQTAWKLLVGLAMENSRNYASFRGMRALRWTSITFAAGRLLTSSGF